MTKLEELNMDLEKRLAIKENLKNRIMSLEKNRNEYKLETNELLEKMRDIKEIKNISLFMIISPFIIVLALNIILGNLIMDIGWEQIMKVFLYSLAVLNAYHETKNVIKYKKILAKIRDKYSIASQNLFAEEYFLKTSKKHLLENDKEINYFRKEINKLNYSNDIQTINETELYEINKPKVLVKKIK